MKACRITGGAHSGKSRALIERMRELSGSMLLVCACPASADFLSSKAPSGTQVMTARAAALWVLDKAGFERTRLLEPFEEQFLFEDLRTTGLPQKQLRKIIEFVYAGLAACKDREPGWLEMTEERLVHDTLTASLAFTGGIVEAELANRATRALAADAELRKRLGFSHVIVDDYGLLNRSSQLLCNALAQTSITAAGEPGFSLAVEDAHPNPSGLDEFLELHPNAEVIELAPDGEPVLPEETLALDTLRDEFDEVASIVKGAFAETSQPSIAVVGANGAWLRNIARTLEAAGTPIEVPQRRIRIRDFCDKGGCAHALKATIARLANDPDDGVALRSLFGFGNHLAHSTEFKRLRDANPGRTIDELEIASDLRRQYAEEIASMLRASDEKADDSQTGRVVVCTPEETFGRHFDLVVFGGFVPGWIPRRAYYDAVGARKQQLLEQARLAIDCARRAAERQLVFTSFTACDLEFAERYELHYDRVQLRNGTRTCAIGPVQLD